VSVRCDAAILCVSCVYALQRPGGKRARCACGQRCVFLGPCDLARGVRTALRTPQREIARGRARRGLPRSSQLRAVSARHRKTDSAFPYLPTRTAMPSNLSRRARGACAVSHARAERVLYATRLQRAEKLGCVGCGPTATPSLCRYGDAKPLGTQHREAGAGPLRDELRQAQCGAGARLVGLGFGWG